MIMINGDKWVIKVGVGMTCCLILQKWKIILMEKISSMAKEESGKLRSKGYHGMY